MIFVSCVEVCLSCRISFSILTVSCSLFLF
uniref:Uncharacterized protein n=1 Tax=Wuchereria bancrofti TaxID=6293 RepID=A0AAF5PR43_WUCBA